MHLTVGKTIKIKILRISKFSTLTKKHGVFNPTVVNKSHMTTSTLASQLPIGWLGLMKPLTCLKQRDASCVI